MPNRRGHEPERNNSYRKNNKLKEKASSFHGRIPVDTQAPPESRIRRPNTLPDLLGGRSLSLTDVRPKLTKLLINVTVQGSVGAVQVLISPESTVEELITATVKQYLKEGRRPIIDADAAKFDLHYSQFSLERLNREEKLMELGSRNFFLCAKRVGAGADTASSCSNEVEKVVKIQVSPWLKFMDFLL